MKTITIYIISASARLIWVNKVSLHKIQTTFAFRRLLAITFILKKTAVIADINICKLCLFVFGVIDERPDFIFV